MADLNALIAQGVQFQAPPNPFAQYAQMQQLQQGEQANQLNQMKMQEMQRGLQEQNQLRQLYGRPGVDITSPAFGQEIAAISPSAYQAHLKAVQESKKSAADIALAEARIGQAQGETLKTKQQLQKDQRDFVRDSLSNLSFNPSDANITAWTEDAVLMKHLTPEKAEAKRQELLSMPLLDRKAYLAQQGMTSADTAKLFESMPKEKTDGRTKWTEEGNPRLPTFGQRMMGTKPITMQLSPGEASTAATAAARLNFDKTKVQWERDNPGFTIEKVGQPDGTEQFVAVDKRTRQATPINMAPTAAPAGGGRGSVGTTDATAGVSAGVPLVGVSNKPLNESQSNATAFGMRMKEANSIAEKLISSGTLRGANIESVPFIGESLGKVLPSAVGGTSGQQQQLNQAKSNFITAVLRKESGAVISDSEFDRENNKYFPQMNDNEATIKQKANARKLAIEAIKIQAGPGAKSIDQLKVSGDTDGEWKVVK
jgi:hypothetical protein